MDKQNRLLAHTGRAMLAFLLMLSCLLLPLGYTHATESGSYKFQTPPDIFDSKFKDPYNFSSLPHTFVEDYTWGARLNEVAGGFGKEQIYIRYIREASSTGNPFAMIYVSTMFPHTKDFWLDWACRMSTSAWTYVRYSELPNIHTSFRDFYDSKLMNIPIERDDPWAIFKMSHGVSDMNGIMKAAKSGLTDAIATVAGSYSIGLRGLEQDKVKAFYLAAEAARRGNYGAWYMLSSMYDKGIAGLFPPSTQMGTAAKQTAMYIGALTTYATMEEAEGAFPKVVKGSYDYEEIVAINDLARSWSDKTKTLLDQRIAEQQKRIINPQLKRFNRELVEYLKNEIEVRNAKSLIGLYKDLEAKNGN